MPLDLIIWVGSLIVAGLVFIWAIKVMKATIQAAIFIAIIVLVLQLFFGIGPSTLWQQVINLPQSLWNLVIKK